MKYAIKCHSVCSEDGAYKIIINRTIITLIIIIIIVIIAYKIILMMMIIIIMIGVRRPRLPAGIILLQYIISIILLQHMYIVAVYY